MLMFLFPLISEKNDERYLPEEEFSDDEIPAEDDDFKKEPSPPPKKHAPEKHTKVSFTLFCTFEHTNL